MDLKEATKILNNLVMYCRFNKKKEYTEEQLFNAIEYFASNKFIQIEKIEELIENESLNISGFECISVKDVQELLEEK